MPSIIPCLTKIKVTTVTAENPPVGVLSMRGGTNKMAESRHEKIQFSVRLG